MARDLSEESESLWSLTAPPLSWAAHFLLSYGTAAVWCAKVVDRGGSLEGARWAIAAYTMIALAAVFAAGFRGWSRHRLARARLPHDEDSPADRHRFLGFASVLLAGLSAVAILWAGLAAAFITSCE